MNTAWIFIEKSVTGKNQRTELYGSFTQLYRDEKGLKYLAPSENMCRKVIKYKFENNLFHIEKKVVKRSKHKS